MCRRCRGVLTTSSRRSNGLLQPRHDAQGVAAALVGEGRLGDAPAGVHLADQVVGRDAHVGEEDLGELVGDAGDLPQRTHLDARLVHVDDQVGDALVLGRVAVGAHQHDAQVGLRRAAGPDLLAVDDELVAVDVGAALERGQVGARVRLGVELAPDLVAEEDVLR